MERARVGCGGCPDVVRISRGRYRDVGRIAGGVVDDVEPVGSVNAFPGTGRGGIGLDERGSAGRRRRRRIDYQTERLAHTKIGGR